MSATKITGANQLSIVKQYIDQRTVSDLADTNISNPTNGQVLSYDSSTNKWINSAGGGGGGTIDVITYTIHPNQWQLNSSTGEYECTISSSAYTSAQAPLWSIDTLESNSYNDLIITSAAFNSNGAVFYATELPTTDAVINVYNI